jgi:hypothetical protein
MTLKTHPRRTADGRPLPGFLKLEFSKAADTPRIKALFHPDTKRHADPDGHVAMREEKMFQDHIDHGRAAMLSSEDGFVDTLTIAWHLVVSKNNQPVHKYTEAGSSISFIPGYSSAQVVVAAVTLRDWWKSPPKSMIVAEITEDNIASQKTYRDHLAWIQVRNKATLKEINDISYASVENYQYEGLPSHWFKIGKKTLQKQAGILLTLMDRGTLVHKDGHAINLDLSALAAEGLTRARLEAMASGITSKKQLKRIAPA